MGKVFAALLIILPFSLAIIPEGIFKGIVIMAWFAIAIGFVLSFADFVTRVVVRDMRRKWDD